MIPGEPAIRIDLDLRIPASEITVTQRAVSPAELLLDVIAAQLLTLAATFPQDTPEELAAAQPGLVPHPAAGLGDIIAVLQAANALSPAIVPPLDPGTAWIDVLAAGQSAEVRARLPLRWN